MNCICRIFQIGFQFSQPVAVKVTALAVETEKDAITEISSPSISNFATSPSLFFHFSNISFTFLKSIFLRSKKMKQHIARGTTNLTWVIFISCILAITIQSENLSHIYSFIPKLKPDIVDNRTHGHGINPSFPCLR